MIASFIKRRSSQFILLPNGSNLVNSGGSSAAFLIIRWRSRRDGIHLMTGIVSKTDSLNEPPAAQAACRIFDRI